MGLFTFTVAGGGFILIGACESLISSYSYLNSDPSSPLSQIKTAPVSRPKTHQWSSSLSYIFPSIFSLLFVLNSLVSLFDAFNSRDRIGSALQLQVLAVAMLFLFYTVLGLLMNLKNSFSLPESILDLLLLFGFAEEFLLFYLKRKDTIGIENRYFDLMLVPILICVVSTVLELRSKKSSYPKLARGVGLILQGTWFLQMGFSFYTSLMVHGCSLHEKSRGNYTVKCKGHPEYHRGRAIATLQFNCHLALLVALFVGTFSIVGKRNGVLRDFTQYRPLALGAEMQQVQNVEHFTLDSDDDLDDGIKEEDNSVKQKATTLELGVNGHGSHE